MTSKQSEQNSAIRRFINGFGQMDARFIRLGHALFLIALMIDMFRRARLVRTLYGIHGPMPESSLRFIPREFSDGLWIRSFSAFSFFQNDVWITLVFLLAGVACVLLAIGYHRRWLYWFLIYITISFKARFPLVLTGGDFESTWWLIWFSIFPWKEILDAGNPGKTIVSTGTRVFCIHFISFYMLAGLMKSGAAWHNGTAIQNSLLFDFLRNPGFDWLLGFPKLLSVATYCVYWFEISAAFLLVWPAENKKLRVVVVSLFIGFHVMVGAVFHTFPLAEFGVASWILFIPGNVWPAFIAAPRSFFEDKSAGGGGRLIALAYLALLFELGAALGAFQGLRRKFVIRECLTLSTFLGARPHWSFIAPDAPVSTGWIIIRGVKKDGLDVSVNTVEGRLDQPLSEKKPAFRTSYLKDRAWSRLFFNLAVPWYSAAVSDGILTYACEKFPDLKQIEIAGFKQKITDGKLNPPEQVLIARDYCVLRRKLTYEQSQKEQFVRKDF